MQTQILQWNKDIEKLSSMNVTIGESIKHKQLEPKLPFKYFILGSIISLGLFLSVFPYMILDLAQQGQYTYELLGYVFSTKEIVLGNSLLIVCFISLTSHMAIKFNRLYTKQRNEWFEKQNIFKKTVTPEFITEKSKLYDTLFEQYSKSIDIFQELITNPPQEKLNEHQKFAMFIIDQGFVRKQLEPILSFA